MTTKTKTPNSTLEAVTGGARSAAQAWIDLGAEQAQGYERMLRAQLEHLQESTRDMNEFAGAMAKSTLEASEAARKQGLEFATKAFAQV